MQGQGQRPRTHGHPHGGGPLGWLGAVLHLHGHAERDLGADPAFATREGIRTLWLALAALGVTTLLQVAIVAASGSVALLADTVHNLGDTLNSVPLLAAFYLARRAATRRYTHGYGRAEDLAGGGVVLSIVFSAGYILWESLGKLLDPRPIERLPWVAAAAVVGFLGNEAVALFQIRTGRRIGSEALVADGLHARIDGLTSLAVLAAVAGAALGYPIVDPIVGFLIGAGIVVIARDAARRVWERLMDAVDPSVVDRIEQYAGEVPGVDRVASVRARWVGHRLQAEVGIVPDDELPLGEVRRMVEAVRGVLLDHVRHLALVTVEVLPPDFAEIGAGGGAAATPSVLGILPPRYRDPGAAVSAAPMGSAALRYGADGAVAWDEMWTGFCELALAGGAPHRGTLLEPVDEAEIAADPERYAWVLAELERGLRLVTGLPVRRSGVPGWIGMECESEEMALWVLRAVVVENVAVRREGNVLWFPAGPAFRLEREIKNVITVAAKTAHYWREHAAGGAARAR
ncbi:MAG: Cobalt-zinc-cadmium resistance protein CzcD [uncultured Gemmatimonadaceae bacterium]|uniref:Cobalt-zinc-cadmium resistance protein CzcD n=1 Tax=uncultured Gemmatimonadaceae bacterium TaxID=246130 RepID=A0A6J4K5M3_9BACT|nr:MAG: Cobalt-zinc-cadmium resistance protein CzcD [uncultured Gemmatimonadaceae bacterium]